MIKNLITFCVALIAFQNVVAQQKKFKVHTVAFYNVENFYDTINDPKTRDDEWVYTSKNFSRKTHNLAKVISLIGTDENPNSPTIIGLAEVENKRVLDALANDPQL